MKTISFIILFSIYVVNNLSYAEMSPHLNLAFVKSGDQDAIYVTTKDLITFNGCSTSHWQITAANAERRNRIYSTLITALISGRKIKLEYGTECGDFNYHKGSSVEIVY